MKKLFYFSLALLLLHSMLVAQNPVEFSISGTISSEENAQELQGVRVLAFPFDDSSRVQSTLSDINGKYQLIWYFTGIENSRPAFDNQLLVNGQYNTIDITALTNNPIYEASVYNLSGQLLAQIALKPTATNTYRGVFHANTNQLLIIQAGTMAVKYLTGYQNRSTRSVKSKDETRTNSIELTKKRKAGALNTPFRFIVSHPDSLFQPIDTVISDINAEQDITQNFEMQNWPVFSARVTSTIFSYFGPEPNAFIVFTQLSDTTKVDTMPAYHSSGGIYQIDFPIPAKANNRMLPDTLLYKVNCWVYPYFPVIDTLALSHGDYEYHPSLIINPELIFAEASVYVSNTLTQKPIANVSVQIKTKTDTLQKTTNSAGYAWFNNIPVSVSGNMPDIIEGIISLEAVGYQNHIDTQYLTLGGYSFDYELQPYLNYTLVINSQDGEGNNLPGVNWLVLSADSVLIGQGNTGSDALDTLIFQKTNPNLDVIIKSYLTEHVDFRIETNLAAETTEHRITENSLLE